MALLVGLKSLGDDEAVIEGKTGRREADRQRELVAAELIADGPVPEELVLERELLPEAAIDEALAVDVSVAEEAMPTMSWPPQSWSLKGQSRTEDSCLK